ncbi:MAG: histidine kinase dimerization/phospho-acceptor domain-containing protein [Gemmatimonadota bacterium]
MDIRTLELLTGLAHELRTPLGAIAGYAELLRLGAHGPMPATQLEMLARIVRNQQAAVEILDAVVAYGTASSGALPLHPTPTQVATLVQDAVDACALSAAQRGVKLHLAGSSDDVGVVDVMVVVDAAAAHVVITAMLRDAIRSASAGDAIEVSLSSGADVAQVDVAHPVLATALVAYDGESLFTPYARGAAQRHVSGDVEALALPQARALARRSGGDVVAVLESSRHTLRLTFPRVVGTIATAG